MNRILIIAHAPLAHALRQAALHVFPDCGARVLALDVQASEAPEATLQSATLLLQSTDGMADTLVLTDVLGATPGNVVQRLLQLWPGVAGQGAGRLRALAGVNLPMLLRAHCYAHLPLDEMQERALAGGTQGIMGMTFTPPQEQKRDLPDDSAHHHHQQ